MFRNISLKCAPKVERKRNTKRLLRTIVKCLWFDVIVLWIKASHKSSLLKVLKGIYFQEIIGETLNKRINQLQNFFKTKLLCGCFCLTVAFFGQKNFTPNSHFGLLQKNVDFSLWKLWKHNAISAFPKLRVFFNIRLLYYSSLPRLNVLYRPMFYATNHYLKLNCHIVSQSAFHQTLIYASIQFSYSTTSNILL